MGLQVSRSLSSEGDATDGDVLYRICLCSVEQHKLGKQRYLHFARGRTRSVVDDQKLIFFHIVEEFVWGVEFFFDILYVPVLVILRQLDSDSLSLSDIKIGIILKKCSFEEDHVCFTTTTRLPTTRASNVARLVR